MKKVLFLASVVKKHIMVFHIPYLKWFKDKGYEVHVCANNDYDNKLDCNIPFCDKFYDIPFERSPLKIKNIIAYKKLTKIINKNNYDIIHCHTPIGGALGRIASKNARKKGTKVIYTAHGFHFFQGASYLNWLIYYTIEKCLSSYADILITINKEDYEVAINKKFKSKKIKLVNGVGINLERFKHQTDSEKYGLRDTYGYSQNDFILIYVAELSYRKNQTLLIKMANKLKNKIPNLKVLLVGSGGLEGQYRNEIQELGLNENVKLLGFRSDVEALMKLSDIGVSASRQEGLPVNIMEAMATGLPLVVTDCRGNRDLVSHNKNGYVVKIDDVDEFSNAIQKLYKENELRRIFGEKNLENIEEYGLEKTIKQMGEIYNE